MVESYLITLRVKNTNMPITYITIPNQSTASVSYGFLPAGVNCVTMSVANYCYGFATGSFSFLFSGSLSGSYFNTAISASAQKNNCGVCQTGSFYTTIVPAGTFSSSVSQVAADTSASVYLTSVSQSNANTFGSCSFNYYYNTQLSASVQRNDCGPCGTGSFVLYTVPASSSMFTNTCSLSEAQTSASIYFAANSQSYANTNGTCSFTTFYNEPISASIQKNDCTGSLTGSYSWVSVPASQSNSTCSLADANNKAQIYFNANSQSWANESGYCYDTIGIITLFNNKIDINDATTASIFPITASVIQSASTIPPSENDAKWKAMTWFSQSYAMQASTYPSQYVGLISGAGEAVWIKVRDKNGNKVNTHGFDTTGDFILQSTYTSVTFGGTTIGLDASRIFTNKMTSSVATNSIGIQLRNLDSRQTVTASVYYSTSSNNWPNFTSSEWNLLGYSYSSSFTTVNREYQFPAFYSGSATMSRQESYQNWSATPQYLYFKFQSGSTPINGGGVALVTASNGTTYSSSISGSYPNTMIKLEITAPSSSDNNQIFLNLNAQN
jgi:hypothetical protein